VPTLSRWLRPARPAAALVLLYALLGPLLYVLLARDTRPPLTLPPLSQASGGPYRVYVADWGYHSSIVVEQPPGWRMGPPGEEGAPFLEFAWGDRRFYMESDYKAIFATLFRPTDSVMYLDGQKVPPQGGGGARAVFVRRVDSATLRALLTELERSILHAPSGERAAAFPSAPGYSGRFYPAHGAYLWAGDCNWWTVERLRAAGLAEHGRGVVFSGQVADRLRGFTPAAQTAGSSASARTRRPGLVVRRSPDRPELQGRLEAELLRQRSARVSRHGTVGPPIEVRS
jgi:hypothetical protein